MSSIALYLWQWYGAELNEFEEIHKLIGGKPSGIKGARQQVNHVYTLMLSLRFQAFCRELHSECVDHLVRAVSSTAMRSVIRQNFVAARMLDRGNPSYENIGKDFNRLGLTFWDDVIAYNPKNGKRRKLLDDLNHWRNAIAHHDFKPQKLGSASLTLATVRGWRRACNGLAVDFDEVARRHLASLIGRPPW